MINKLYKGKRAPSEVPKMIPSRLKHFRRKHPFLSSLIYGTAVGAPIILGSRFIKDPEIQKNVGILGALGGVGTWTYNTIQGDKDREDLRLKQQIDILNQFGII